MVTAKNLGTEYDSAGVYIPSFSPGTKKRKPLYIKGESNAAPVLKTDIFAFYVKYEGKFETAPEVFAPMYSLYNRLSGYIRRIQFIPPDPGRNRQYPSFEILVQDDGDNDFFKIEAIADSSAATSLCSSLLDPRADFSLPFIFTCYKKEDKTNKQVYVNVPITQTHLPPRDGGYTDNLFFPMRKQLPTRWDAKLNKSLPDWFSSDWTPVSAVPSQYHNKPIFLGVVDFLNDEVIKANGTPPTDEEILTELRGDSNNSTSTVAPSSGYDQDEDDEPDFLDAFNATPITPAASTNAPDELAPLFSALEWTAAEKATFYNTTFGVKDTLTLIAAGKLEVAKDYLIKLAEIYRIANELSPALAASDDDRKTIVTMQSFAREKGIPGVSVINQTLAKAQGLKATQADPFAEAPKAIADIPF